MLILRDQRRQNQLCNTQVIRIEAAHHSFEIPGQDLRSAPESLVRLECYSAPLVSRVVKVVANDLQLRRIDPTAISYVVKQAIDEFPIVGASSRKCRPRDRQLGLLTAETFEPIFVVEDIGYRAL